MILVGATGDAGEIAKILVVKRLGWVFWKGVDVDERGSGSGGSGVDVGGRVCRKD